MPGGAGAFSGGFRIYAQAAKRNAIRTKNAAGNPQRGGAFGAASNVYKDLAFMVFLFLRYERKK
jgi:hypothetical protein